MDTINLASFSNDEAKERFQRLIQPLKQKAYKDPIFKAEFIANPKEVIQRELGIRVDLPDKWSFKVRDQSNPYALYIKLPAKEKVVDL